MQQETQTSPNTFPDQSARAITKRSVLLGTLCAAGITGLAPYNDFVVSNGFLVANYLPIVVIFLLFTLAIYNGIARLLIPKLSFSAPELAVATLMMLVACSVPCQGFLRAFLPTLVHPFYHGQIYPDFWSAFKSFNLPTYLYPVGNIAEGRTSNIVLWFYGRVPPDQPIPYGAWIIPILVWGIFFACLMTALVSMAMLVFPQWAENERLAFPIAQVELALIEPPEHGKAFNDLFRSPGFWIAAISVLIIHGLTGWNAYNEKVPKFPLSYDFTSIMTEDPWTYLNYSIKTNRIIFVFVGMAFFIQTRTSFSIWFIYILLDIYRTLYKSLYQYEVPQNALNDMHLGSSVILLAGVFWVGRHYWFNVAINAFGKYRVILSLLAISLMGMTTWLIFFGVSVHMAMMIIAFILIAHLVTARVVAETGLPIFRALTVVGQVYMPYDTSVTGRDVYFAGVFSANGAYATRESLFAFTQNGLRLFDLTAPGQRKRRTIGLLITWTLLISIFVGTWSSLHMYYSYAAPLTSKVNAEYINPNGVKTLPDLSTVQPVIAFHRGSPLFNGSYSPAKQIFAGAGITLLLTILAYRYAGWPLLPIGFVISSTDFCISNSWYSILIGWLCKVIILRLGGATLYKSARPIFIGLIIGEVLACAMWLIINLLLASLGYDYNVVQLLPS